MSANTDFIFSGNVEVCREIGSRLRAQRLAKNLQQTELAKKADVSKLTIINLESKGTVTFLSFIQIVRALGLIDELADLFKPQTTSIAMMELAEAGKKRVRASPRRKKPA